MLRSPIALDEATTVASHDTCNFFNSPTRLHELRLASVPHLQTSHTNCQAEAPICSNAVRSPVLPRRRIHLMATATANISATTITANTSCHAPTSARIPVAIVVLTFPRISYNPSTLARAGCVPRTSVNSQCHTPSISGPAQESVPMDECMGRPVVQMGLASTTATEHVRAIFSRNGHRQIGVIPIRIRLRLSNPRSQKLCGCIGCCAHSSCRLNAATCLTPSSFRCDNQSTQFAQSCGPDRSTARVPRRAAQNAACPAPCECPATTTRGHASCPEASRNRDAHPARRTTSAARSSTEDFGGTSHGPCPLIWVVGNNVRACKLASHNEGEDCERHQALACATVMGAERYDRPTA